MEAPEVGPPRHDPASATRLTDEQRALLPSDEDVRFYQEHGYYISKKIFTESDLAAFIRASERFYAGDLDEPSVPVPEQYRPKGDYGDRLRKHDFATFFSRELARLTRSPLLGAIAARLAGAPGIRLWADQLLYKPVDRSGQAAGVGWHTDRQYWQMCTSSEMLTAWIPFHDCDEQMGTIEFIDSSRHWPDNTADLDFFSGDLRGLEERFNSGGNPIVKVPANLEKGQVSFHHCLTIHGSAPNRSNAPRRSIAVHFQDESNRYRAYRLPSGELAFDDAELLCRKVDGVPDFADPASFPVLFQGRA